MKSLAFFLSLTGVLWTSAAFSQQVRSAPMPSDPLNQLDARTRQSWQAHVKDSAQVPLQAGCDPYYLAPQGPIKGSVVLLHGFTACAQQNDELAPQLAKAGFHVFVPRVPGHGLKASQNGQKWRDDLSAMPTYETHERYRDFAKHMGDLVRYEPGIKTIAGVSLGGSLAASSVLQNPHLFDRSIIMTPLFDISSPRNMVLPPLEVLAPDFRVHWGAICDLERGKNRGGYCEFGMTQLRGMQQFGLDTLDQLDQLGVRTQLVGVEYDDAASNAAILKASQKLPFGQTCLYAKGASHSMLSPYDNQHMSKPWMPRLRAQIQRFIETGQYFDQTGPSLESGFQRCLSQ